MTPKPQAAPRPVDIMLARPRPQQTVAMAVADVGGSRFRYSARSNTQQWNGTVQADAADTAVLDAIRKVQRETGAERTRFVLQVSIRSVLWALRDEIALLMPGVFIDRPRLDDESLLRAALSGLRRATESPGPVWVATDGSVRGSFTGYGWLASSGEHGLQGFRHSTRLIGDDVVLVAELRAIGQAVQKLRGRDLTVLSDSKRAIAMAHRWMNGDDVLPAGYATYRESGKTPGLVRARQLIREDRDRITLVWVKGHRGEPLNEGADALARLASRYARGDSGLDGAEYHRRAEDLATTFSKEFTKQHADRPQASRPPADVRNHCSAASRRRTAVADGATSA